MPWGRTSSRTTAGSGPGRSPWRGRSAHGSTLRDEAGVRGTTDSEWLAALWRTRLRQAPDRGAAAALRATLPEVRDLAIQHQGGISANLVLVGPAGFLAVRFADPGPAPSLYLAEGHPRWPGGVMIASEPIDETDCWQAVPPSTFVQVDGRGVCVEPLGIPGEVI